MFNLGTFSLIKNKSSSLVLLPLPLYELSYVF